MVSNYEIGSVMAEWEGYFDESGSFEEEPGVFCVAGYLIESAQAAAMDQRWGEILAQHNIPYFHMVDCAHGAPPFADMEKAERIEVEMKLIGLIKE
jgi:hypothetical protein